jgi:hypothetical protein
VQGTRTVTLPPAGEVVKTLQPGPDDGKGNYFYDAWDCANHGASNQLGIGRFTNNGAVQRALLGFDLSDIPASVTLNLDLRNIYSPGTTVTAQIHRVTRSWEEGNGRGEDCADPGASWKYASAGVPWTTPGGNFDPLVVASKTQTAGQAVGTDTYDIKSLVGQWVAGSAANHGMLFKLSDETPGTNKYVHYRSDDHMTDVAHRPKLTVHYRDDRVDTTGPTVISSGDLWDNRASVIDRYAKLSIRATDAGTGTRDIKIFVNGHEQSASASRTTACAGCELTLEWRLNYGDVDLVDDNNIEIRATDMNGNTGSVAWRMLLDSPEDSVDYTVTAGVSEADSATPVGTQADGCSAPENYIPGVESCPTVTADASSSTATAEPRAASTALAPGGPGWGVADQKPEVFGMEGTRQLRPRIVRKIVPWDILRRARIPDEPVNYYCRPKEENGEKVKVTVERDTATLTEWEQWLRNAKAMADAQGRTIEVIVSFERTRKKAAYCYLPTTQQYSEAVTEFIAKYKNGSADMPPVRNYSAWNEPNHSGQPTSWNRARTKWKGRLRGPEQAGRYWVALNWVCFPAPGCKAIAAEFTDGAGGLFSKSGSFPAYWPAYLKGLAGYAPQYWAFHPYWTGQEVARTAPEPNASPRSPEDAKRVFARLDRFITAVLGRNPRAEIWFTEQGARWHLLSPDEIPHTDFHGRLDDETDKRATKVMKALTTEVIGRSSAIKVFTVYQMVSHDVPVTKEKPYGEGWDSGLLKYTGDPAWQLWSPRGMWHTYKAIAAP